MWEELCWRHAACRAAQKSIRKDWLDVVRDQLELNRGQKKGSGGKRDWSWSRWRYDLGFEELLVGFRKGPQRIFQTETRTRKEHLRNCNWLDVTGAKGAENTFPPICIPDWHLTSGLPSLSPFIFYFLPHHAACRILVPRPGIKSMSPALGA